MFTPKHIYIWIYVLLMAAIPGAQTLYNGVGHIPATHQLKWHNAGLLKDCNSITPKLVINVNSLPGINDDERVSTALSMARDHVYGPSGTGGMAIVYFPERTYNLSTPIRIAFPDSNLVLQGDGSDKTILNFISIAQGFHPGAENQSGHQAR